MHQINIKSLDKWRGDELRDEMNAKEEQILQYQEENKALQRKKQSLALENMNLKDEMNNLRTEISNVRRYLYCRKKHA